MGSHTHTHPHTHTYARTQTHMLAQTHSHTHTHIHIHRHVGTRIHAHTHTHTHTQIHTNTHKHSVCPEHIHVSLLNVVLTLYIISTLCKADDRCRVNKLLSVKIVETNMVETKDLERSRNMEEILLTRTSFSAALRPGLFI